MKTLLLFAIAPLFVVTAADDELDLLNEEYQKAYNKWVRALQAAQGDDADGEIEWSKMPPHPAGKFMSRFRAYGEKHAGKPEALEALVRVIELASFSGRSVTNDDGMDDVNWAIGQLTTDHAANPDIEAHIRIIDRAKWAVQSTRLEKFYKAVIAKNKSREAVAAAKFGLAMKYQQGTRGLFGTITKMDKARALLEEIEKDFKDTSAGEKAGAYLYELNHLKVGMTAPDFEGEDADGNKIKLSQFRGKIVVLDYWGYW